jgi:uncharacterized phage protein gp47/JayE
MAFELKSTEQLLDDIQVAVLESGSPLTDFSQGSVTYTLMRAFMSVLAKGYINLDEAFLNSFIATAEDLALDAHVNSFGLFRKQGTLSVGNLVARPKIPSSPVTLQVIADTTRFTTTDGQLQYVATTDTQVSAPFTLVPISATQIGGDYDLPPNTVLIPNDPFLNANWTFVVGTDGLDSLSNPIGFLRGGSDRESDEDLRVRFTDFINSLSRSTYRAVRSAILGVPDVTSVVLLEFVPAVGWFTAFIDDGTDAPSESLIDAVKAAIGEAKAAGIAYEVYAMPKTFVNTTIEVKIDPTFSAAAIQQAVIDSVKSLLNSFVFGQSLYLSKLVDAAHNVSGVLKATVFQPATDIIVGPEEVIRAGIITVNVVL